MPLEDDIIRKNGIVPVQRCTAYMSLADRKIDMQTQDVELDLI